MQKKIIISILVVILVVGGILIFGNKPLNKNLPNTNSNKNTVNQTKNNKSDISNVCSYFPKELVESAIGKPIVKIETPFTDNKSCFYYTFYSETYDHTPYGDEPGGTPVVAVYDDEDFAKDKAYNETHGSKYGSDASIGMDNYVVRNTANKIWQTVLILGQDRYIRIHFVHDAVTGEDLVKIAAKFADKIQSGK